MANLKKNGAPSTKGAPIEYTEDRVPVYTLYLENIPQTTSRNKLKKYFSTFGEVASVIVKKNKFQRNFLYGLVEFTKPEFAAMALKQPIHPVISRGTIIRVKPADTWKQPGFAQSAESKTDPLIEDSSDPAASILSLNEDCLIHIFSFLNQIERLKLSFVCQRFYDIVKHAIKVTKLLDFSGMQWNFTLMQIRQILTWFGTDIRRLHLHGTHEVCNRYLDFIGSNCRNLEEVKFESLSIHQETYKRFFNSSKQLHTMVLEDCDIIDKVCGMIGSLPALRSLNLAHNCHITGRFLRNLKSLTELSLSNCEHITTRLFIKICKSLKLTSLNIVGCLQLTDQAFMTLVKTQTALEQLMISGPFSYDSRRVYLVGRLTVLKHIRIHRLVDTDFDTAILREIVKNRKDVLESLEIYNLCVTVKKRNRDRILELQNLRKFCLVRDKHLDDNYLEELSKNCKLLERVNIAGSVLVSNTGIENLVRNLKHLRFLNISFCKQFKDSLIHQIYSVLNDARGTERESPLTLCVHETGIAKSFLKTNAFVEAGSVDLYCEYLNPNKQVQEIYHVVRNPKFMEGIWGTDIVIVTVKTAFQKTSYVSPIKSLYAEVLGIGASLIVATFGEFAPDKIDGKARYANCKLGGYNRDEMGNRRESVSHIENIFSNADTGGIIINVFSRQELFSLYHHCDKGQGIIGIYLSFYENNRFIEKHINRSFISPRRRSGQKDIFDGKYGYFFIINMYLVCVMFTRCLSTFN